MRVLQMTARRRATQCYGRFVQLHSQIFPKCAPLSCKRKPASRLLSVSAISAAFMLTSIAALLHFAVGPQHFDWLSSTILPTNALSAAPTLSLRRYIRSQENSQFSILFMPSVKDLTQLPPSTAKVDTKLAYIVDSSGSVTQDVNRTAEGFVIVNSEVTAITSRNQDEAVHESQIAGNAHSQNSYKASVNKGHTVANKAEGAVEHSQPKPVAQEYKSDIPYQNVKPTSQDTSTPGEYSLLSGHPSYPTQGYTSRTYQPAGTTVSKGTFRAPLRPGCSGAGFPQVCNATGADYDDGWLTVKVEDASNVLGWLGEYVAPAVCRSFDEPVPQSYECLSLQVVEAKTSENGGSVLVLLLGPHTEWQAVMPVNLGILHSFFERQPREVAPMHVYIHTAGGPPPSGALPLLSSALTCVVGGDVSVQLLQSATRQQLSKLRQASRVLLMPLLSLPSSYAAAAALQSASFAEISAAHAQNALFQCVQQRKNAHLSCPDTFLEAAGVPPGCSFPAATPGGNDACPTQLIVVAYATGKHQQLHNLEPLLAYLRAAFGGPGAAAVVPLDISAPTVTLGTVASLYSMADLVLTQWGLTALGGVFMEDTSRLVLLDACWHKPSQVELGGFLEGVLRQYGASEYRTTLIRNGVFPPGVPKLDAFAPRALGGFRVPIPHVHFDVAALLKREQQRGEYHVGSSPTSEPAASNSRPAKPVFETLGSFGDLLRDVAAIREGRGIKSRNQNESSQQLSNGLGESFAALGGRLYARDNRTWLNAWGNMQDSIALRIGQEPYLSSQLQCISPTPPAGLLSSPLWWSNAAPPAAEQVAHEPFQLTPPDEAVKARIEAVYADGQQLKTLLAQYSPHARAMARLQGRDGPKLLKQIKSWVKLAQRQTAVYRRRYLLTQKLHRQFDKRQLTNFADDTSEVQLWNDRQLLDTRLDSGSIVDVNDFPRASGEAAPQRNLNVASTDSAVGKSGTQINIDSATQEEHRQSGESQQQSSAFEAGTNRINQDDMVESKTLKVDSRASLQVSGQWDSSGQQAAVVDSDYDFNFDQYVRNRPHGHPSYPHNPRFPDILGSNATLQERYNGPAKEVHPAMTLLTQAIRKLLPPSRQECTPTDTANRVCVYRHLYAWGGQFFFLHESGDSEPLPVPLHSERTVIDAPSGWLMTVPYHHVTGAFLAAALGAEKMDQDTSSPVEWILQTLNITVGDTADATQNGKEALGNLSSDNLKKSAMDQKQTSEPVSARRRHTTTTLNGQATEQAPQFDAEDGFQEMPSEESTLCLYTNFLSHEPAADDLKRAPELKNTKCMQAAELAETLRMASRLETIPAVALTSPLNAGNMYHFLGEQVPLLHGFLCAYWGICETGDEGKSGFEWKLVLWSQKHRMDRMLERLPVVIDIMDCLSSQSWEWWMRADLDSQQGPLSYFRNGHAMSDNKKPVPWQTVHGLVHVDFLVAGFGNYIREFINPDDQWSKQLYVRPLLPLGVQVGLKSRLMRCIGKQSSEFLKPIALDRPEVLIFDRTSASRAFLGIEEHVERLQKHFGESVNVRLHSAQGGTFRQQETKFAESTLAVLSHGAGMSHALMLPYQGLTLDVTYKELDYLHAYPYDIARDLDAFNILLTGYDVPIDHTVLLDSADVQTGIEDMLRRFSSCVSADERSKAAKQVLRIVVNYLSGGRPISYMKYNLRKFCVSVHGALFEVLMRSAQYKLDYNMLQDSIEHGLYVQLLRFAPDVLEGLVQLNTESYTTLLETLHRRASDRQLVHQEAMRSEHLMKALLDAARRLGKV